MKVYRDAWGIPHLRAADAGELAFLQGRNAAEDRAWQLELGRHRCQGTTAGFLGAGAVDWDRFARRVRLDDTARRCFQALDGDTRGWLTAYVDGVNAGLARGAARAPEFAATGVAPGRWRPWTPLGTWLTIHVLFAGFPDKMWRGHVTRHLGAEAAGLFVSEPVSVGSNAWLVSGEHSVTGAAIIAGDPHRFIEDPGVYQQIRLACPEFDVVGLAVPGVPGVAHFGHTGGVAWAITNAMADYQDLYLERLRRQGSQVQALGPDGWVPAAAHTETVEVAGGDPVEVEVIETERGPVVVGGPGDEPAISLRYPPRAGAGLGFAALPALLRATTVADVDRALDLWVEPVNVVLAADTGGGLLHRTAGRVPVRHPGNRRGVVPAWDPGHEWRGWHDPMPRARVDGIAVMANERALAEPLGTDFAAPYRARRIRDLLSRRAAWSASEMPAIHTDTLLPSAQPLLDLAAGLDGLGAAAGQLRDRLLRWDRRMDLDSTDASAYAAVRAAVVRRLAAHPLLSRLAEPAGYPGVFNPWFDLVPRIAFGLGNLLTTRVPPEVAGIVRAALAEVAARPQAPGPWGEAHRLTPSRTVPWPGLTEVAVPGDHDCVLSTSSVPGVTDRFARGPAARYVWDLARRDDSLWSVPLGASGVPGDPHHHDQLAPWARGELVPVVTDWNLLTEDAVDQPAADGLYAGPCDEDL